MGDKAIEGARGTRLGWPGGEVVWRVPKEAPVWQDQARGCQPGRALFTPLWRTAPSTWEEG